jgi:DNA helicase-2/ATP-dependent DNA helicase PcrA
MALLPMLAAGSGASVRDVVAHIYANGLFALDERLTALLDNRAPAVESAVSDAANLFTFLDCPAEQLNGYRRYIEKQSPFDTQQGIKGAEFPKVVVVLDDEEGRHNQFSYDKYLGLKELSNDDRKGISAGDEGILDRTRRLFYVCCSRATENLAVVLFAKNPSFAFQELRSSGIFVPKSIQLIT